jgi:hypothetical protein
VGASLDHQLGASQSFANADVYFPDSSASSFTSSRPDGPRKVYLLMVQLGETSGCGVPWPVACTWIWWNAACVKSATGKPAARVKMPAALLPEQEAELELAVAPVVASETV